MNAKSFVREATQRTGCEERRAEVLIFAVFRCLVRCRAQSFAPRRIGIPIHEAAGFTVEPIERRQKHFQRRRELRRDVRGFVSREPIAPARLCSWKCSVL